MDKNKIIKICIIALLAIFAVIYYILNNKEYTYEEKIPENIVIQNTISEQTVEKEMIKIYITGEVKNPGVIELEVGSRIDDAINNAGGLTQESDLSSINLAYEVSDGEKIYIPNKNEKENDEYSESKENSSNNGKVNINKANISELKQIPGVGSSTAEKIVQYREKNGKFATIEDLKKVSGIGDSKFESIKDYISVK